MGEALLDLRVADGTELHGATLVEESPSLPMTAILDVSMPIQAMAAATGIMGSATDTMPSFSSQPQATESADLPSSSAAWQPQQGSKVEAINGTRPSPEPCGTGSSDAAKLRDRTGVDRMPIRGQSALGTLAGRTKTLASPAVRQLAMEKGVDLRAVKGSEPDGRVVRGALKQIVQFLFISTKPSHLKYN